jgi:hypothetical protein
MWPACWLVQATSSAHAQWQQGACQHHWKQTNSANSANSAITSHSK